jgi:hypothetical protein
MEKPHFSGTRADEGPLGSASVSITCTSGFESPLDEGTDRLSDVSLSLKLLLNAIAQVYSAGGIGLAFEAAVGDSQGVIVRAQEDSPHRPSGGTRIRLRAGGVPMQHPLIEGRRLPPWWDASAKWPEEAVPDTRFCMCHLRWGTTRSNRNALSRISSTVPSSPRAPYREVRLNTGRAQAWPNSRAAGPASYPASFQYRRRSRVKACPAFCQSHHRPSHGVRVCQSNAMLPAPPVPGVPVSRPQRVSA